MAVWLSMGFAVGRAIRGLERLSDTVASVGRATERTGAAIESLGGVLVVGDRIPDAAAAVRSAIGSARTSRRSVRRTSILPGISIAAIPTLPAESRATSPRPWAEFVAGRHRELADAVLVRVGLRRRSRSPDA